MKIPHFTHTELHKFRVRFIGRVDAVDVAQELTETVLATTPGNAITTLYLKYEHVIWPSVEEMIP